MSHLIVPGQEWRLLMSARGHSFVPAVCRVEEVDGKTVVLTRIASGTRCTVSLNTLRRCLRGARMIRNEHGVAVEQSAARPHPRSNAQARRAAALLAEGLSVPQIAERFGVANGTVRNWAMIVRREQKA